MDEQSPAEVTTTFLKRFSDGQFDEADDLIHPGGPLEGASDVAFLASLLVTNFLAMFVLGAIPTEVVERTVIEEGPTTARVDAALDVADVGTIDAAVELRPQGYEEDDPGDGRRDVWRVWTVDLNL
jgi:hypothetical protein